MNPEQRAQLTESALQVLQMVALDILQEAHDKGQGGLSNVDVRDQAVSNGQGHEWQVFRGILGRLMERGLVVNDHPGSPGQWRLAK